MADRLARVNDVISSINVSMEKTAGQARALKEADNALKDSVNDLVTGLQNENRVMATLKMAISGHMQSVRDAVREKKRLAAAEEHLSRLMKIAEFQAGNYAEKIDMTAKGMSTLGEKVGKFTNFLSTQNKKLGDVKGTLVAYNRQALEMSRIMQSLGRNEGLSEARWSVLQRGLHLSRIEMSKMYKEVVEIQKGLPLTAEKFADLARVVQDRFGSTPEVMKEAFQRIQSINDKFPGLSEVIAGDPEAFKGNISSMIFELDRLGASNRELLAFQQLNTPMTGAQKYMTTLETAMQSRDKAIEDANTKMGLNAQDALVSIEKSMTTLVETTGKLANAFAPITTFMISLKTIGMSNIMGMTGAVKSLSNQFAGLGTNAQRAASSMKSANNAASSGKGGGGRGGSMAMGGLALAAGVITTGMSAYGSYRTAGELSRSVAGESLADKYSRQMQADRARSKGNWTTIGGIAGGVVGGAIGSVIPGAGTMMGIGVGTAAGGYLGGMMGNKGPDKKGSSEMMKSLAAMETLKHLKDVSYDLDSKNFKTQKDIYSYIKQQSSEKKQTYAALALVESKVASIKDIERKIGKNIADNVKKIREENKLSEESARLALVRNQRLKQALSLLEQTSNMAGELAQHYGAMASSSGDLLGGFGRQEAMLKKQVSFVDMQNSALDKQLAAYRSTHDAVFEISKVTEAIADSEKLTVDEAKKFNILQRSILTAKGDEKKVAQENLNEFIKANGIDEKRVEATKKLISANVELGKKTFEMGIERKKDEGVSAKVLANLTQSVAKSEGMAKLAERNRTIASAEADLVEATAAGYAVAFAQRKKVYDLTVQQTAHEKQALKDLDKSHMSQMKSIFNNKEDAKALKDKGVTQDLLLRASRRDAAAVYEVNEKMRGVSDELKTRTGIEKTLSHYIDVRANKEEKILQLQKAQVDQAMALKEGYLDVINEMTTGSDIVSNLLPDAQRGIVALHEMNMSLRGGEMGGAMRRGFVSVNPFADSQNVANAPAYTQQGFRGGAMQGIAQEYMKSLVGSLKSENIQGPGFAAAQAPKSVTWGEGMATGGMIPGVASSVDNRMGILDGKQPIRLASGEFIVNAKSAQKNRALLEMINAPGFANGGAIDFAAIKSGNIKEISNLRRYMRNRGVMSHDMLMSTVRKIKGGLFTHDIESMEDLDERIFNIQAGGKHGILKSGLGEGILNMIVSPLMNLQEAIAGPALSRTNTSATKVGAYSGPTYVSGETTDGSSAAQKAFNQRQFQKDTAATLDMGGTEALRKSGMEYAKAMSGSDAEKSFRRGQALNMALYGTTDAKEIERMKSPLSADLLGGFAAGGMAGLNPYGLGGGMNASSLAISGGLRIGTLNLNGKAIGQDLAGGSGDEWRTAEKNLNG